jgi:hypothetical protein
MIPEHDERGNLPPGIHFATWTELVTRYATSTHRRELLDGLLDALRSLDPELQDFSDERAAQKARYGGELFPADWAAHPDGMSFLDIFQSDHTGQPKGIIAIDLGGLP